MSLEELESRMVSCRACSLYRNGRVVSARLGTDARIGSIELMVVGEAPDRESVACGHPFSGPLRPLLDTWLRRLCPSGRFVIVNVLKHRPTRPDGSDRYPSREEIAACLPFLEAQVDLYEPTWIVGVGTAAFVALTGGDERGFDAAVRSCQKWMYRGRECSFLYHPGSVLTRAQGASEEVIEALAAKHSRKR
jgi:uracil-DNA glycosylase